jgi:phosphatidylinositol-3-phosphatase
MNFFQCVVNNAAEHSAKGDAFANFRRTNETHVQDPDFFKRPRHSSLLRMPRSVLQLTNLLRNLPLYQNWRSKMRRRICAMAVVIFVVPLVCLAGVGDETPDVAGAPHVVLIIEENRSFSSVYPDGMPWLSALGDRNGIATNYFSDEPGSLLDYLWLSSGSGERPFGCGGAGCPDIITSDNIFRELDKNGLSWKVYADSLPYAGFMGARSGDYVKRHNPAPWYSDVAYDPDMRQRIVPFTQFPTDLAARDLPNYSVIIPNLLHDAHNGTMAMADIWLKQHISPLLNSSYFDPGSNGTMFITFDDANGDRQGRVFTAVIGANVIPGIKVDIEFRHENTLRTIMGLLGLTNFPGASEDAAPMHEFFK